ncbi:uncharacterized protein LOC120325430 [Styela clava]
MSNIPDLGLVSNINSGEDEPSAPSQSEGDCESQGSLRELINSVHSLKRIVVEQQEEIKELRSDMMEYTKRIEGLQQQLDQALKKCENAEEKIRTLEKVAEEKESEIQNLKRHETHFKNVVAENEALREKLSQCGVKKINWWKVVCLSAIAIVGYAALSNLAPTCSGSLLISTGSSVIYWGAAVTKRWGLLAGAAIGGVSCTIEGDSRGLQTPLLT